MFIYISIAAVIICAVFIVILVALRREKFSASDARLVVREWEAIRQKAHHDARRAIFDADKLLDFLLKKKGFQGSLGDKLKQAHSYFTNLDAVWAAHKLRNRIAHEMGFEVTEGETQKALSAYKQGLWDLGIKF